MKIWYSLLAGAFLTTALHAETIVDKNAEKGVDLSGKITISDDAASGKRSYKAGRTELSVKEYIHLDPDYTYTISLKYKAADNNTAFIHVGVHPFNSAGRSISASHVAASNDTITRLLKPAEKGDTEIYVHNATKWRNVPGRVAAFFATADLSDIPNRNISGAIESIVCNTVNGDVIRFKKPLTFDVPAGTLVRQHASSGPYHYVFNSSVKPGKWETWTSAPLTAADLRHAAKVRLVIVANAHGAAAKGTLLVDDIKVERHKKTAPAAPAVGQPDEGTLAFFDAENGSSGLSGKITIADEGAASGHSFRAGRTEVSVSKPIQIQDDAQYRFSAKFKPGNGKRCIVHLGVHPFDVSGRSIPATWVSPVDNSMTEVVQDAKKGDKSIVVRSAARWSRRAGAVVAFSVAEDLSDLPNRIVSGAITDIRQVSEGYVVELKTPLNFDVPAGTAVRQHLSGGFYHYLRVRDFKPGSDWTEVATDFLASKNLRYASAVRLVLVINAEKSALESELLIDDIKVEKKKDKSDSKMTGNILSDSDFTSGSSGEFGHWSIGQRDVELKLLPGAGVNGSNAVRVKFNSATAISYCGIEVAPSAPYLIGGYVRTKNFRAERSGFTLHDSGRYWTFRTGNFPENTNGKWVKVEKVIPGPAGVFTRWIKSCMFDIEAVNSSGELEISSVYMIPMTEDGKKGTKVNPPVNMVFKRIFPLSPVLNKVRAAKPVVSFAVYYPTGNNGPSAYECEVSFAGQTKRFPLDKQQNFVAEFAPVKAGKYEFVCKLFRKGSNEVLLSNSYLCTAIIDRPAEKAVKLNNLVSELFTVPLENRTYDFELSTDRWVWIGLKNADRDSKVFIDGQPHPVIYYRDGEVSETMRFLTAGKHQLTVTGAGKDNIISVRLVKQLILFPFNVWSEEHVNHKLHKYGMPFFKKYLLNNFNTIHIMAEVEMGLPYFKGIMSGLDAIGKERGKRLITSGNSTWDKPDALNEDVRTGKGIEKYHGRALDEIGTWWSFDRQMSVAEGLWKLNDFDKHVYLWMAQTRSCLFYPMIHRPLLSAIANVGGGVGKMYMETYIINQPDQAALEKYMQCLNDHVRYAELSLPDARERMVFMMSGYVSQGAWCTSVYPDGDMKYATDYFFWKFANDPQLEGIYGLGYYDFRHSDEELVRWTAALFRHYCIDGNKTMLSEKYGFTCTPGHIKNGDFNEGMDHWQPVPAEEGSLTHWNLKGFGGNAWQLRQREEGSHGDYAAQFIRSAKAPNKLTQIARGLTPGKKYALLFVTADADDAVNRLCHRREFQFNVSLKGATVLPEFSNEYRLPRTIPENPQNRRCEFVNHKVVFTADKPEVTVTFSDWQDDSTPGAPIGQKRVVNYISLVPFFDEGM